MGKKDKLLQGLLLLILRRQTELLQLIDEQVANDYLDFMRAKPCWQKHWRR